MTTHPPNPKKVHLLAALLLLGSHLLRLPLPARPSHGLLVPGQVRQCPLFFFQPTPFLSYVPVSFSGGLVFVLVTIDLQTLMQLLANLVFFQEIILQFKQSSLLPTVSPPTI